MKKITKEKILQICSKVWNWIKQSRYEALLLIIIGALLPRLWDNVWYTVYYTKALVTEDFQSDIYAQYVCQLERDSQALILAIKLITIALLGWWYNRKTQKNK